MTSTYTNTKWGKSKGRKEPASPAERFEMTQFLKNVIWAIAIAAVLVVIVGATVSLTNSLSVPTPQPTPCGRTLFGVGVLEFKIDKFGTDCRPPAESPTPTTTSSPEPTIMSVSATPIPQTVYNITVSGNCNNVVIDTANSGGNVVECNTSTLGNPTATPTSAIKAPRPTPSISPTPTCTPTPVCDCW